MKKAAAKYLVYFCAVLLTGFYFAPATAARDVKPQATETRRQSGERTETALKTLVHGQELDKKIIQEAGELKQKLGLLLTKSFWQKGLSALREAGELILAVIVLLFAGMLFLLCRFKRYCRGLLFRPFLAQHPHRRTALQLFSRSLPLLGATIFIYIYSQTRLPYAAAPILRVLAYILLTLLVSGWWLNLMALKGREKKTV
jgi:hypothetical protein